MTVTSKQKEEKCGSCGRMKPKRELRCNGRKIHCLECKAQYRRIYEQRCREGQATHTPHVSSAEVGIEIWSQVESVIREMAESQYKVQTEYAGLEKRIAALKKYTDEIVETELIHQINFQLMLEAFLRNTGSTEQAILKRFDFGVLRFHRGKLDLDLNADYAGQRMGKP